MSASLHSSSMYSVNDLTASTVTDRSGTTVGTSSTAAPTEMGSSQQDQTRRPGPSGLSIALARQKDSNEASPVGSVSDPTPTAEVPPHGLPAISQSVESRNRAAVYDGLLLAPTTQSSGGNSDDERSPLLVKMAQSSSPAYNTTQHHALPLPSSSKQKKSHSFNALSLRVKKVATMGTLTYVAKTSVASIPAVVLGTLLNILDGVSCASLPDFLYCRC